MDARLLLPPGSFVYPGAQLAHAGQGLAAGTGAFVEGDTITSALCGYFAFDGAVSVVSGRETSFAVPLEVGHIVLARVERLRDHFCSLSIFAVEGKPLPQPLPAQIKREHMRPGDTDQLKPQRLLAPGDVVRACVKSLSDSAAVLLGIEADELGVVASRSAARRLLRPVASDRMQSPESGAEHPKKVAFKVAGPAN